ncbi:hypothetical protein [Glutamicibacter sp.]|uniref:hypothetical protein n=1 Tax=Glutamicibacter sp. TaxID=1931995 RepID=UPI003D6B17B3
MKKSSLWVLPAAIALALTGCAGSDTETGGTAESTGTSESAGASGKALDAAQVKAVIDKVMEGQDGAQVLDNDTLQQQQDSLDLSALTEGISPKECADLQKENSFTDLSKAYAAAGVVAESAGSTTVQLLSLKDDATSQTIESLLEFDDFGKCSTMQVESGGQQLDIESMVLDVDTQAPHELAISTTTLTGGKAVQDSVNVQALDGSTYVLVNVIGQPGAEGLQEQATQLAEKTLAEARNAQ